MGLVYDPERDYLWAGVGYSLWRYDGSNWKEDVPRRMTVESSLEWIGDDELVEVTPKSVRSSRKSVV